MSSISDSSESEEIDEILRKAVDVSLPFDFNPNSVPRDGTEYLHHVMYERRNIKKYVTADIDTNKYRKNQTFRIPMEKSIIPICKEYLPSDEWQLEAIKDFCDFKQIVEDQIGTRFIQRTTSFCEHQFLKNLKIEGPQFSTFVKYSQSVKIRMLEIITKHLDSMLNNWKVEDHVGEWIFAILTTLSIPLSPNSCHVIRHFIKTCKSIRSKCPIEVNIEVYEPLNFFICISSRIYGQIDLSDK